MIDIYYFSGTGNTLWSARTIGEGLAVAGEEVRFHTIGAIMMSDTSRAAMVSDTAAVILFPAYGYGAPPVVQRFLRIFAPPGYTALLVTYGSSPGGALGQAARLLDRGGHKGSRYYGRIPAVENYIPIFGPPPAATIEERVAAQAAATAQALAAIHTRTTNEVSRLHPVSSYVSWLFSVGRRLFWRWYQVNAACTGCGVCAQVCPVGAIRIEAHRPVFTNRCEHCQGCLNWCPSHAITFGRMGPDTPQYHHPAVEASALAGQGEGRPHSRPAGVNDFEN